MWEELARSLQNGNMYVITIIFIAFISAVVVFERFIMLYFVYNIDFQKFLLNLKKLVLSEDNDRAINLCKSVSNTSIPKIALHALEAAENDPTSVRHVIEEEAVLFLPKIEARLGMLPSAATLILFIGILGTIDALWGAFHSIDVLDTAKKQASIASGVAGSLNSTALGLFITMIVLIAHNFLKSIALKLLEDVHYGTLVVTNLLAPQELSFVPQMASGGQNYMVDEGSKPSKEIVENRPSEVGAQDAEDSSIEDIKDEEEII